MYPSNSSRLKLLHFISGDLWAGAETMACNLLRRLKENDHLDLAVILFNEGRLAEELRASGIAVRIIDEKIYSFWDILRELRRTIGKNPPDIIHSHRYKENFLALLISLCNPHIKRVSTQHGLPEYHTKKPGIVQELKIKTHFLMLSRYFSTIAVSEDIRNVLTGRFGFNKNNVRVIPNGIELPAHLSHREMGKDFAIGSSGRLFPVKDYALMIEIARAATRAGADNIQFELAGDGPELPGARRPWFSAGG